MDNGSVTIVLTNGILLALFICLHCFHILQVLKSGLTILKCDAINRSKKNTVHCVITARDADLDPNLV